MSALRCQHRPALFALSMALLLSGATRALAQSTETSLNTDASVKSDDANAAAAAPAANAAFPNWNSLFIRSGGLVASFNSNLRLDVKNTSTGTSVSFENDLGFTRTTGKWFIDGEWRIAGRHRLYASFVQVKRDATRSGISQPITIGGTTFQIGANLQAFIDTSYLSFDYGFALVKNARTDVAATFGVSTVRVHTGAGLQVQTTTSGSIPRTLQTDSHDRSIFPTPGVQVRIRVAPKVTIEGYARYIKATLQGLTQSSTDGRAGAEFPLFSHLGFGADYYFNHVAQEGSRQSFTGKLTYSFHGPQIYGLLYF
jgi:hypothetical protein